LDLSKLSAPDKRVLYAAIGVIIGGIIGIGDVWGIGATVGLIAGLAAAAVVLQPQLMPAATLPAPKGTLLLACGAIAAGGFALGILTWLGYAIDVTRIYSILFDLGFVAALALLYFSWIEYRSTMPAAAPTAPATPPAPPAPPAG
jgi:hypothetical protein